MIEENEGTDVAGLQLRQQSAHHEAVAQIALPALDGNGMFSAGCARRVSAVAVFETRKQKTPPETGPGGAEVDTMRAAWSRPGKAVR